MLERLFLTVRDFSLLWFVVVVLLELHSDIIAMVDSVLTIKSM